MITHWNTRRLLIVSLALLALILPTMLIPSAAEASASGCRPGGGGYFCFKVDGTGKYVRNVTFERSRSGMIRRPSATIVVKDTMGNEVWRNTYSENNSWYLARTLRLNIDFRFADNAGQICGQWREDGYYSEICHSMK